MLFNFYSAPPSGDGAFSFPFTDPTRSNIKRGLARWRDSLGRVRNKGYGVDVVVLGDSTGTFGDWFSTWPYLLRNKLQARFNNPAVLGGFGFIPAFHTNYPSGAQDASHRFSDVNPFRSSGASWEGFSARDPDGNAATGNVQARPARGDITYNMYGRFDPTVTTFNGITVDGKELRFGVSDWEYVGLLYSGVADRMYQDSALAAGVIVPSHVVAPIPTNSWGEHWAVQSGLNPLVANTLQVGPTLKNQDTVSAAQCWINGLILYNGDYNEGVRLHNLCNEGSDSFVIGSNTGAQNYQANIDQFSTGANGGSRNAKLFIINTMLNDCGYTANNISVATYKTNLQNMITQIVGRPSKPCVMLVVNQPPDTNAADATRLANYPNYREACYQLASANPDTVAVYDKWKALTDATHLEYAPHGTNTTGGAMADRGWWLDGVHPTPNGQFSQACQMFSLLTAGV